MDLFFLRNTVPHISLHWMYHRCIITAHLGYRIRTMWKRQQNVEEKKINLKMSWCRDIHIKYNMNLFVYQTAIHLTGDLVRNVNVFVYCRKVRWPLLNWCIPTILISSIYSETFITLTWKEDQYLYTFYRIDGHLGE